MPKPRENGNIPDADCGAVALRECITQSDFLEVGGDGELLIERHRCADLLAAFGSPLYVTSEKSLLANYRRFRDAFDRRWPAVVRVFYATKCNPNLAIRAILRGAGADVECFSAGEYDTCLDCGFARDQIMVNGSSKEDGFLATLAAAGSIVNIDSVEEIDALERLASPTDPVPVNLRLKISTPALDGFDAAFFKGVGSVNEAVRRSKWGFGAAAATDLVRRLMAMPQVRLLGYSSHVGRFSNLPQAYAAVAREVAATASRIAAATGFKPAVLDLGGGWARHREPESRGFDLNPHTIEDYADAVTGALKEELGQGEGARLPELWLEPGRYIVGNAVTLLATVGSVKRDVGRAWVHVDASTNDLMRIETSQSRHVILPAGRMNEAFAETVDVVGPTCIPSLLGADRRMPPLDRGDIVAILDAGMYAEAISNRFNSVPAPANVLLSGEGAEYIRVPEAPRDLYATHRIPEAHRPALLNRREELPR
ncbi:MAG: hypothetical protein AB7L41_08875 [Flavobacteriaceae bacterium]